jgi:hypothetical protein
MSATYACCEHCGGWCQPRNAHKVPCRPPCVVGTRSTDIDEQRTPCPYCCEDDCDRPDVCGAELDEQETT